MAGKAIPFHSIPFHSIPLIPLAFHWLAATSDQRPATSDEPSDTGSEATLAATRHSALTHSDTQISPQRCNAEHLGTPGVSQLQPQPCLASQRPNLETTTGSIRLLCFSTLTPSTPHARPVSIITNTTSTTSTYNHLTTYFTNPLKTRFNSQLCTCDAKLGAPKKRKKKPRASRHKQGGTVFRFWYVCIRVLTRFSPMTRRIHQWTIERRHPRPRRHRHRHPHHILTN